MTAEAYRKTRRCLLRMAGAALIAVATWMVVDARAEVGRRMPDEGQQHVPEGTPVTYGHSPPTSGPHWPRWARWDVYAREVPPEIWVHNLEHGGIVILYRCDTPCPDLIQQLGEVYRTFPKSKHGHVKLLITPYRNLRTRLAILAWTWLDELNEFDRERSSAFTRPMWTGALKTCPDRLTVAASPPRAEGRERPPLPAAPGY